MRRIGRRSFIKALAAGGLAAGCSRFGVRRDTDIAVLGAGLAGLSAARQLRAAGRDVVVLEARDRPGGRVHTAFDLPDRPEYGGVEIGDSYTRIHALAEEFGLAIEPADRAWYQAATLHVNGQSLDARDWPGSPANRLAGSERSLPPSRLESHYLAAANPLRAVADWDGADQHLHDRSIGDVLRRLGASSEALRLVNVAGNHNHADEVSALPAWRSALAFRMETGVGRLAAGAGTLPRALAEDLGPQVRYRSTVVAVQAETGGLKIHLADGTALRARHCVCTLPIPVLGNVALDLPLADDQRRAIRDIRYTRVTVALFDAEPFWEDDGLPPYMWTDSALERLFPRVSADGTRCIGFKAFINGRGTTEIDALGETAFARLALATLGRIRPASQGRVRYVARHRWAEDPFAGGAYAAWSPGAVARQRSAVRRSAGPVAFAGEHTAVDAPGMEGAVRSGERAALEIIETRRAGAFRFDG